VIRIDDGPYLILVLILVGVHGASFLEVKVKRADLLKLFRA